MSSLQCNPHLLYLRSGGCNRSTIISMQVNNLIIHFFFVLMVLEIGGNLHTLNQENVDSTPEVLPVCENLKVLSILNYNLDLNSKVYFKKFLNLEKLYLWQCHSRLFKCAKNSLNLDFKCELNPLSPLRDIIYASKEKQGTALVSAIFSCVKSNPRL